MSRSDAKDGAPRSRASSAGSRARESLVIDNPVVSAETLVRGSREMRYTQLGAALGSQSKKPCPFDEPLLIISDATASLIYNMAYNIIMEQSSPFRFSSLMYRLGSDAKIQNSHAEFTEGGLNSMISVMASLPIPYLPSYALNDSGTKIRKYFQMLAQRAGGKFPFEVTFTEFEDLLDQIAKPVSGWKKGQDVLSKMVEEDSKMQYEELLKRKNIKDAIKSLASVEATPIPPAQEPYKAEPIPKFQTRARKRLMEEDKLRKHVQRDPAAAAVAGPPSIFKAEELLRPLTRSEQDKVDNALQSPYDNVWKHDSDSITTTNLQTLAPGTWLNDEVIHFYLAMLKTRDAKLYDAGRIKLRSHFFKSFFFTKLLDENGYSYKNVKRWSKKAPGGNLFELDKIIAPVNLGSSHWTCLVAYVQKKKIVYCDSMNGDGSRYTEGMLRYLEDEYNAKGYTFGFDRDEWELNSRNLDYPQQRNGYDCGVFATTCADFAASNLPFNFSQDDIAENRRRICLKILNDSADP